MDCYSCGNEATQQCPRCGNPYCAEHGDDLCAACLDPVSAAPTNTVFRASLLGLLVGSVFALWLLVRSPGLPDETRQIAAPESAPPPFAASPTPTPPAETVTPVATEAPAATPTPVPTEVAPGPVTYIIEDGDTVFGIAEFFGVNYLDMLAVNGLTEEDAALLQPGDELVIPQ